MTRPLADYVALALIANDRSDAFYTTPQNFSGDLLQLKAHAEEVCGFQISDATLRDAIRTLADCNLVRVTDDAYAGTFVKVKSSEFPSFVSRAQNEIAAVEEDGRKKLDILLSPSDFPSAAGLLKHELLDDYHELGETWLKKALGGLQARAFNGDLEQSDEPWIGHAIADNIPASDRIVTLSDNQQVALESASDEVIKSVELENSIEGDPTLRSIVLGQLKAGRELIRAKCLNAFLLYQTLTTVLGKLIAKYKDQALGYAAKKLFDLLAEHIFGK